MCAKDIIMLIWLLPVMNSLTPIVVIMDTMADIKERIYFIMDGIVPFAVMLLFSSLTGGKGLPNL